MDLIPAAASAPRHTAKDVARSLPCSVVTVRRYVSNGDWPHTWVGRRLRFSDEQVGEIQRLWIRPVPASSTRQAG